MRKLVFKDGESFKGESDYAIASEMRKASFNPCESLCEFMEDVASRCDFAFTATGEEHTDAAAFVTALVHAGEATFEEA